MSTLTEVFPCFFLSCKANARVKPAKTGHGPHSSWFLCRSVYCLFCVVPCIVCVYMCTVLLPPGGYPIAVKYISYRMYHIYIYHILSYHIIYIISYHTTPHHITSYTISYIPYHISYHIYHIISYIISYHTVHFRCHKLSQISPPCCVQFKSVEDTRVHWEVFSCSSRAVWTPRLLWHEVPVLRNEGGLLLFGQS